MKTVNVLGGTATVNDTFEIRAGKGQFYDIGMAYAAARSAHPELKSINLLSTRYVNALGHDMDWRDDYAETVWTFELPAPEQPVEDPTLGYLVLSTDPNFTSIIPCESEEIALARRDALNGGMKPGYQNWIATRVMPL